MTDAPSPSLPDDLPEQLRPLVELVDQRQRDFDHLWPEVVRLRRIFFVDGGEAARTAMENAIRKAELARDELETATASEPRTGRVRRPQSVSLMDTSIELFAGATSLRRQRLNVRTSMFLE